MQVLSEHRLAVHAPCGFQFMGEQLRAFERSGGTFANCTRTHRAELATGPID